MGKGGKNGQKWIKVGKSGEKLGKVGKGGEKCGKWRKVGKSREKWEKVFFFNFGQNGRRRPFWMSENNFRSQFLPFQIDTQLVGKVGKVGKGGEKSVIELVRDIWMNNACVKFEERSLNHSKVIALTTK